MADAESLSTNPSEGLFDRLKHLPTSARLRQTFQYSNWGFVILAELFPKLTNLSCLGFVKHRILDALGMDGTYQTLNEARATGRMTEGFATIGGENRSLGYGFVDGGGEGWAGTAGIVSSADDLASLWAS